MQGEGNDDRGVWVQGEGGVDWDMVQKWVCEDGSGVPREGDADSPLPDLAALAHPTRASLSDLANPFMGATPHQTPYIPRFPKMASSPSQRREESPARVRPFAHGAGLSGCFDIFGTPPASPAVIGVPGGGRGVAVSLEDSRWYSASGGSASPSVEGSPRVPLGGIPTWGGGGWT